mmetsp:Transcript_20804/g.59216  ORF Transcript_20804/g.59216 Transcript_20804/m.59216 type:complete len:208 (+) Transcript_20804:460-1083(+)
MPSVCTRLMGGMVPGSCFSSSCWLSVPAAAAAASRTRPGEELVSGCWGTASRCILLPASPCNAPTLPLAPLGEPRSLAPPSLRSAAAPFAVGAAASLDSGSASGAGGAEPSAYVALGGSFVRSGEPGRPSPAASRWLPCSTAAVAATGPAVGSPGATVACGTGAAAVGGDGGCAGSAWRLALGRTVMKSDSRARPGVLWTWCGRRWR